jgi:C_GCAxxG_C_C family probable redox protein
VLLAVCQKFELKIDKEIIPSIAFGFAGGIGNTGDVCGAVAGGIMAISYKKKRGATKKETFQTLELIQEFRCRFEAKMNTIYCRELTGLDLSTPEGIEQSMKVNTAQNVCFPAVGLAYRLVVELLKENV